MTFPNDHRYPGELPVLRLKGHAFQDVGVADDIAFEQGEDRSRQIYSFNAQLVSISTLLTQARFDRFVAWYEDELLAGTKRFDVPVAQQGGAVRRALAWWEAQYVGPYRWDKRSRGFYEVSAELLLLDGPYATRTAPTLRGEMRLVTQLVAAPVIDSVLRGSMTLTTELQGRPTLPVLRGEMTLTTELTGYLGDPAVIAGDVDLERLWMGLAQLQIASDEVDRTAQEVLTRAWIGVNDGLY